MTPAYCRMFLDARRILGLDEWELAQRLATDVGTIRALESGQLAALPSWPETSRVVSAYLTGLGMDPRPVLHSLAHDLTAIAAAQPAPGIRSASGASSHPRGTAEPRAGRTAAADVEPHAPRSSIRAWIGRFGGAPAMVRRSARSGLVSGRRAAGRAGSLFSGRNGSRDRDADNDVGSPASGRARRIGRTVMAAVVCLALAAAVQTSVASTMMTAATSPLPATVTRAFGRVADLVRAQLAPIRDGLRWIEVEDPRSRRGDKLQTARR